MPEMIEALPEKCVKRIEEPAISLKKISQLEADLEELKKDKDVELIRLAAKMAEIEANFMRKIAETKRKNDDLEARLSDQNTEVREGKAKIGELDGKINALQSKNSDLESQIQFERIKTAELVKWQADLNRTFTFVDRDGWSYLPKTASWYKVIDQKMTFEDAEAYCASRKSHLVSIQSQEENDFVQKLARTVHSDSSFYIGLKRNPNKGNALEWTDGSSVDFTNWDEGEPCSETHADLWSGDGKWGTSDPTFQCCFICKRSSPF